MSYLEDFSISCYTHMHAYIKLINHSHRINLIMNSLAEMITTHKAVIYSTISCTRHGI